MKCQGEAPCLVPRLLPNGGRRRPRVWGTPGSVLQNTPNTSLFALRVYTHTLRLLARSARRPGGGQRLRQRLAEHVSVAYSCSRDCR